MYKQNDESKKRGYMNILVGMSGGVDSSVTALILKEQGYNVIGATMKIYRGNLPKHTCTKGACYGPDEEEDIEETKRIAKQIGIPYFVFDCAEEYEKIVLENFKSEYSEGKTPNPCIWCNSLIKFGVLPQLAKAHGIEFDKFATGHYARVESVSSSNNQYLLKAGIDSRKDQSYFLYRLTQEQLKNIILPLGNYTKSEIRNIANEFGLEVAEKPDSQDFYGGDYNELLNLEPKRGNIIDKNEKILGSHNGIWNYTIGQRKGLGISSTEPLYVLELRKESNEVVVGFKDETMSDSLVATNLSWVSGTSPIGDIKCKAKIRSASSSTPVLVKTNKNGNIHVKFKYMQNSIAKGQSIVLYDGDIVLGGGIII